MSHGLAYSYVHLRRELDLQRRQLRKKVIGLVALQFLIGVTVRLTVDNFVYNTYFKGFHFLQPYGVVVVLVVILFYWIFAIWHGFARKD